MCEGTEMVHGFSLLVCRFCSKNTERFLTMHVGELSALHWSKLRIRCCGSRWCIFQVSQSNCRVCNYLEWVGCFVAGMQMFSESSGQISLSTLIKLTQICIK